MEKHGPRPEQTLIAQIDAIEWVNGEFSPLLGGAGPEQDRVGNLDADVLGRGRGKIPKVEGDGDGPTLGAVGFFCWVGCHCCCCCGRWGCRDGEFEEQIAAPFPDDVVGCFEVGFAGDGAQGDKVMGL